MHRSPTSAAEAPESAIEAIADAVLMVRPTAFARNEVTRPTNRFQSDGAQEDTEIIARAALAEFDVAVATLKRHGVDVRVFAGRTTQTLPDEVFPNNWITTHPDGTVVLYPLMAWNRRPERRRDIIELLQQQVNGFRINRLIDLSYLEAKNQFLEGSGSLVFDHGNRLAYACISPRTHIPALREFARVAEFDIVAIKAADRNGHAIYHTNVFMSLGAGYALVCLKAIDAVDDRLRIVTRLERSGREVIEFNLDQLHSFVGNMLQLRGRDGNIIAASREAFAALSDEQREALSRHGKLVQFDVSTIETSGGGSVRCMLAELMLRRKSETSGVAADD